MPGLVMREVLLKFQRITHSVYLVPENITDRQREHRLRIIGCIIKRQYLFRYRMQRDESLHLCFASLFTDISPVIGGLADMVRIKSVNIHISQSGQWIENYQCNQ